MVSGRVRPPVSDRLDRSARAASGSVLDPAIDDDRTRVLVGLPGRGSQEAEYHGTSPLAVGDQVRAHFKPEAGTWWIGPRGTGSPNVRWTPGPFSEYGENTLYPAVDAIVDWDWEPSRQYMYCGTGAGWGYDVDYDSLGNPNADSQIRVGIPAGAVDFPAFEWLHGPGDYTRRDTSNLDPDLGYRSTEPLGAGTARVRMHFREITAGMTYRFQFVHIKGGFNWFPPDYPTNPPVYIPESIVEVLATSPVFDATLGIIDWETTITPGPSAGYNYDSAETAADGTYDHVGVVMLVNNPNAEEGFVHRQQDADNWMDIPFRWALANACAEQSQIPPAPFKIGERFYCVLTMTPNIMIFEAADPTGTPLPQGDVVDPLGSGTTASRTYEDDALREFDWVMVACARSHPRTSFATPAVTSDGARLHIAETGTAVYYYDPTLRFQHTGYSRINNAVVVAPAEVVYHRWAPDDGVEATSEHVHELLNSDPFNPDPAQVTIGVLSDGTVVVGYTDSPDPDTGTVAPPVASVLEGGQISIGYFVQQLVSGSATQRGIQLAANVGIGFGAATYVPLQVGLGPGAYEHFHNDALPGELGDTDGLGPIINGEVFSYGIGFYHGGVGTTATWRMKDMDPRTTTLKVTVGADYGLGQNFTGVGAAFVSSLGYGGAALAEIIDETTSAVLWSRACVNDGSYEVVELDITGRTSILLRSTCTAFPAGSRISVCFGGLRLERPGDDGERGLDLLYRTRDAVTGDWSAEAFVSRELAGDNDQSAYASSPHITVGADDRVHFTWYMSDFNHPAYFERSTPIARARIMHRALHAGVLGTTTELLRTVNPDGSRTNPAQDWGLTYAGSADTTATTVALAGDEIWLAFLDSRWRYDWQYPDFFNFAVSPPIALAKYPIGNGWSALSFTDAEPTVVTYHGPMNGDSVALAPAGEWGDNGGITGSLVYDPDSGIVWLLWLRNDPFQGGVGSIKNTVFGPFGSGRGLDQMISRSDVPRASYFLTHSETYQNPNSFGPATVYTHNGRTVIAVFYSAAPFTNNDVRDLLYEEIAPSAGLVRDLQLGKLIADGNAVFTLHAHATAAVTLPHLTAAAAGALVPHGVAAARLQHLVASGIGFDVPRGNGAAALKHLVASATGAQTPEAKGPGASALQHLVASAAGAQTPEATGTGAAALKHLGTSAAGTQTPEATGTGAAALKHLVAAGTGTKV